MVADTAGASPDMLPRAPVAPGLPLLGHALEMRKDPLLHFVELYRKHGPIFRVKAFHRAFTILAGVEANTFLQKQGEDYLSSRKLFGGFGRELGADVLLVALDGEPHRHLRKQMRRGFSKGAAEPFIPTFISVVDEITANWKPGDEVPVFPLMQRLVVDQLSDMLSGQRPGDMFDNLWVFFNTLMNVEVLRTWPRLMLKRPRYQRAKARCLAFGEEILERHKREGPKDPPDLIDDTLTMTTVDGHPLSHEAMIAASIGPYFAGMDTVASTLAFMTYAALHDAGVKKAVTEDSDAAIGLGDRLFDDLKSLENLHACALETLRLWPATPFTPRVVEKPFVFEGHRLEVGEELLIAQCVTHYLDEYFPEAHRFELARHKEPRFEVRQHKGVFAPFSLGAHTCLGAGLAEVQIMVTMAALLNRWDLELVDPEPVKVLSTPIPNTGRKWALRVKGRR